MKKSLLERVQSRIRKKGIVTGEIDFGKYPEVIKELSTIFIRSHKDSQTSHWVKIKFFNPEYPTDFIRKDYNLGNTNELELLADHIELAIVHLGADENSIEFPINIFYENRDVLGAINLVKKRYKLNR